MPLPSARVGYIADNGDLQILALGDAVARLPVNALPDARILSDGTGRVLLLAGPTTDYDHNVLGDNVEASQIVLVDAQTPAVITTIDVQGGVVEGIAPLWADLNGDGEREIIVTVSNAQGGARIVAYSEAGEVVAEGPPIGTGYRWRHQLAVAPFGPNG